MAVLEGALVSSMVEDTFFILKTAFTRWVYSVMRILVCV
jgi:hypothetical protein